MTQVLLIRHAEFDGIGRVVVGRTPGVGLNAAGRGRAERLAAALAGVQLDAIFSSPLTRAMETAQAIAAGRSVTPRADEAFLELDWGEWTGRTLDALQSDPRFHQFNVRRSETPIPGGEHMLEAQRRAVRRLEELARTQPPIGRVAVVSHADIIRAVLCHVLGMPIDHLLRLHVDPASVSVMDLTAEHGAVRLINSRGDVAGSLS